MPVEFEGGMRGGMAPPPGMMGPYGQAPYPGQGGQQGYPQGQAGYYQQTPPPGGYHPYQPQRQPYGDSYGEVVQNVRVGQGYQPSRQSNYQPGYSGPVAPQ